MREEGERERERKQKRSRKKKKKKKSNCAERKIEKGLLALLGTVFYWGMVAVLGDIFTRHSLLLGQCYPACGREP